MKRSGLRRTTRLERRAPLGPGRGGGFAQQRRQPPVRSGEREHADAATSLPGSLRVAVWRLDEGRCQMTGRAVPRAADQWVWAAHHPLPQQELRRRGLGHLVGDPRFAFLLTRRAHERHHSRTEPVPLECVPARCVEAIDALGDWAHDLLRRAHPPAGQTGREAYK